jgi:hypothetical protein
MPDCPNCQKIYQHFPFQGISRYVYPNWDFWYENVHLATLEQSIFVWLLSVFFSHRNVKLMKNFSFEMSDFNENGTLDEWAF